MTARARGWVYKAACNATVRAKKKLKKREVTVRVYTYTYVRVRLITCSVKMIVLT